MGRLLGSSMVGLKVTSSKMSYATGCVSRSARRASVAVAGHCRVVPPQETLKHSSGSVSVGSLGSGVHKILFESSEHLGCVWGLILKSENLSVMSDSLWPHGFYSLNSSGQNTGVGNCFLPQGIFPIQGSTPGLPHCRWILYQLSHKGSPKTGYKHSNCHDLKF